MSQMYDSCMLYVRVSKCSLTKSAKAFNDPAKSAPVFVSWIWLQIWSQFGKVLNRRALVDASFAKYSL